MGDLTILDKAKPEVLNDFHASVFNASAVGTPPKLRKVNVDTG